MGIDTAISRFEAALEDVKEALAKRRAQPPPPPAPVEPPAYEREASLLDVRGAAAFLRLSVSWVYKAAERGELPCVRIGSALRFDAEALRDWVKARSR